MDNKKTEDLILQKIKHLEDRIIKLENLLNGKNLINPLINSIPEKKYDCRGKKQDNYKSSKKNDFLVTVDSNLNFIDDSGIIYKISDEECVKNKVVMGDILLVNIVDKEISSIKVSQRAKRVREEALVITKDNNFYAVSKFATHRLLNYDVTKLGVLKGFEVKLLLPKDREAEANVALIDSVESSGGGLTIEKNSSGRDFNSAPPMLQKTDNRVLEDDDLV